MITGCQLNGCMQMAEPKHYAQIVYVLKRLIKLAERRALAWPYLEVAKELLEGFSDANCPISPDDLGWLLSESWNKGTRLMECPSKCPSEYLPVSAPFIDQALSDLFRQALHAFKRNSSRKPSVGWRSPLASRPSRPRSPAAGRSSMSSTRCA